MCQKWLESVQGLFPTYVKYKLFRLPYLIPFFIRTCMGRTCQPISTPNGSKDPVWHKEMPFMVTLLTIPVKVPNLPTKQFLCPLWEFPPGTWNNFWTVRDRRKLPTEHTLKIGVRESNGVDVSGLERPLAAEINIPPLLPIENIHLIINKRLKLEGKCVYWTRIGNRGRPTRWRRHVRWRPLAAETDFPPLRSIEIEHVPVYKWSLCGMTTSYYEAPPSGGNVICL